MSVSEWGGDSEARVPGADVIASGSAAVDPDESANRSGNDGSGDLRAEESQAEIDARRAAERELAKVMDPAAFDDTSTMNFDRRQERQDWATIFAGRALRAGYGRLVSEDDTTVDRVAKVLHAATYPERDSGLVDEATLAWMSMPGLRDHWRSMARAAVRALREAGG